MNLVTQNELAAFGRLSIAEQVDLSTIFKSVQRVIDTRNRESAVPLIPKLVRLAPKFNVCSVGLLSFACLLGHDARNPETEERFVTTAYYAAQAARYFASNPEIEACAQREISALEDIMSERFRHSNSNNLRLH